MSVAEPECSTCSTSEQVEFPAYRSKCPICIKASSNQKLLCASPAKANRHANTCGDASTRFPPHLLNERSGRRKFSGDSLLAGKSVCYLWAKKQNKKTWNNGIGIGIVIVATYHHAFFVFVFNHLVSATFANTWCTFMPQEHHDNESQIHEMSWH